MQSTIRRAAFRHSVRSFSSSARHNPEAILAAALPHIDQTGFTLASIATGNPSIPAQALEALFPSAPSLFSSASTTGPSKALLQHWLSVQRLDLQEYLAASKLSGSDLLREGIHYRLWLNQAHMNALKNAMPVLLHPPTLYGKHAGHISGDISHAAYPTAQGEEWYALRGPLAAIYSAAEIYQLEDTSPEYTQTRQFADRLLDRREQVKGVVGETALFGSYFLKSVKGLYNARFS